jgi:hypothetical protein
MSCLQSREQEQKNNDLCQDSLIRLWIQGINAGAKRLIGEASPFFFAPPGNPFLSRE